MKKSLPSILDAAHGMPNTAKQILRL